MTCLFWRFGISSIRWCLTWLGSSRVVLQWVHWCCFGGSFMSVGALGFGLVVPFLPFGLPGKRFWLVVVGCWLLLLLLLWSPVLVGYLRRADGVCGFSYFSRACFSLLFSVFRIRFSCCSCLSCWQVWLQQVVVVVVVVVGMVWSLVVVVLWF